MQDLTEQESLISLTLYWTRRKANNATELSVEIGEEAHTISLALRTADIQ